MNERDMPKADFVTSIVLLAFSIGVVWMSINMPRLENRDINPLSVPGIVPGFLGVVIGIFALILMVRSVKRRGYSLELNGEKGRAFIVKDSTRRALGTILLCLIYALGFVGRMPYFVATFLFMFAFIVVFEYDKTAEPARKRKKIIYAAVLALLVSGIVASVFRYLFLVSLP